MRRQLRLLFYSKVKKQKQKNGRTSAAVIVITVLVEILLLLKTTSERSFPLVFQVYKEFHFLPIENGLSRSLGPIVFQAWP